MSIVFWISSMARWTLSTTSRKRVVPGPGREIKGVSVVVTPITATPRSSKIFYGWMVALRTGFDVSRLLARIGNLVSEA
jgi:hypothetical protein